MTSAYLEWWNKQEEIADRELLALNKECAQCGRLVNEDAATCDQCTQLVCWLCLDEHRRNCWELFYAEEARQTEMPEPRLEPRSDE